ncbi:hypothetical protein QFZ70_000295 [Arthrobacter sp. V1I9]|uniref:DUF6544 family protein n=1 Tax=Arthrobacter sp. V1I9 TaxID=3042275 RepID=UPI00278F9FAC|nr:DUF6544 family protein [Arthrobacter sp. V1I9]MDQ0867822.1 hypothetical protein [Arthrobacter sp. V1I9]
MPQPPRAHHRTRPHKNVAVKVAFAAVLGAHGLIHLLGAAKGLGFAAVPELSQQISLPLGVLWLVAAALLLAGSVSIFVQPKRWWVPAVVGIVLSQVVIITSWADAAYGTIANLILFVGVVFGYLSDGPHSFHAQYDQDVRHGRARYVRPPALTEADLAGIPDVVQRYVRLSGAVGLPKVQNFSARYHGQIRSGPSAPWMPFTGRQSNFYDRPSRLFLMDASRAGIPFQAFHRFIGPSATMRVKLASAVTVVDAKGPEMDEAETVTLFNDLCVFAPGALADPGIQWREINPLTVSATFTNRSHSITAALSFNDHGELVDFAADGRGARTVDGKSFTKMPWSTPLSNYRQYGPHRIMERGEGIWHAPAGDYSYLRFILDSIEYNVAPLPSGNR